MIDCTQIPLARMGVGVYADNLIRELLPKLEGQDSLFLLAQDDDEAMKNYGTLAPNVRTILLPSAIFRHRVILALFEQLAFPLFALYYRLDVIHSLHYTFPLYCSCKRVVTVHDLTFSLMPQAHTLGRRLVIPFFSRMALKRAEALVFDSSSTRRDFERVFGPGKQWQIVAPLGVSPTFFTHPPVEAVRDVLDRYKIQRPYVLFVGTIEPRKNLVRLIEAFENVGKKYPRCLLVIAGRLGWSYEEVLSKIDTSPMKRNILRLGYISSADKHALLAACEVLVYPSLYEGFGLPVLEGMAMGKPVITSNTSSLPEVAGDGAITIDPTLTKQMEESLDRILSNADLCGLLAEKGRRQASKFSWSQTAEITYRAYRTVVTGRPSAQGATSKAS